MNENEKRQKDETKRKKEFGFSSRLKNPRVVAAEPISIHEYSNRENKEERRERENATSYGTEASVEIRVIPSFSFSGEERREIRGGRHAGSCGHNDPLVAHHWWTGNEN